MSSNTYKRHSFASTNTTTDTARGIRHLYKIDGEFGKAAGRRPFLTSAAACRQYVSDAIYRYSDEGRAATKKALDAAGDE